jgi:hypothetical protein
MMGTHAAPDLRFHERMRGPISFDTRDYNTAVVAGRRERNWCTVDLTTVIDDLDRFLNGPQSPARLEGTVHCPRLGGRLDVQEGTFTAFVRAPDERRRRVLYRLFLRDRDNRPLTLSGFKLIEDDPNHDPWQDCSRLLVRLLAGHVPHGSEEDDDPRIVATGVLRITPLRFARTVLTMRGGPGRRLSAPARYGLAFVGQLLAVYGGRVLPETQFDFPTVRPGRTQLQGRPAGEWHELPGRPSLERRILPFEAGDGCLINLHHIRARGERPKGDPVLLVGGLAMRANSFYATPSWPSLVDALVARGHDVWVENWRTSIDLPAKDYTLDPAAVYDHPAAIRRIREETGCERLDAVAHCMGSASLTMSVLAGLVPELRTVVSSAVSFHIALDDRSRRRLSRLVPVMSLFMRGTDPQWAARAPSTAAAGVARWARFARRDYSNPVNAATAYFYGGQPEALWQRANLDAETLEWLTREFGYAPLSFFRQIGRSAEAGHLVPVEGLPQLSEDRLAASPPDGTRFTFLAGLGNRFFLPEGQRRTWEQFEAEQPGAHAIFELEGFSHLDVLVGRRAHSDVFPHILGALEGQRNGG